MGAQGQVLFAYRTQGTHADKKLGHSFFKGTIGTGLRSRDCAWGHDLRKSAYITRNIVPPICNISFGVALVSDGVTPLPP